MDGEASSLRQMPLPLLANDQSVKINLGAEAEPGIRYEAFLRRASADIYVENGPLKGFAAVFYPEMRAISFRADGLFLCAEQEGGVVADRPNAGAWEQFISLYDEDIESLQFILKHEWIIDGEVIGASDVKLGNDFKIHFGKYSFDLRYQMPIRREDYPFQLTLFDDGWKIRQAFLYKPLIYFTAFKSQVVSRQLYFAIQSLLEFGKYRGHIHVITDQSEAEIRRNVPTLAHDQLTIQASQAADWIGFVSSKYLIVDHVASMACQPILFNDPDIVFDADISHALIATATSPRICAPIEYFSFLASSPSVGASLIQRDGCEPRYSNGFNAGTLGVPNIRDHGKYLRLIRDVIVNHAAAHGRDFHEWADQEIANYVSYRIGHFDTHRLTPFVRYVSSGQESAPRGIAHFWRAVHADTKAKAMEKYLQFLRAA
ncbi:MAG: hypothetical protein ACYCZB_00005 [Acidiphilium sp.]